MSRIRSSDTRPELVLRSALHRLGFRFSLHRKDLPGKPDIVFPKHKTVIFIHGCFWHRHPRCKLAATPKSNPEFWKAKFDGNVSRDKANAVALRKMGWNVVVIWECQIEKDAWRSAIRIAELFHANQDAKPHIHYGQIGHDKSSRDLWRVAEMRSLYHLNKRSPRRS